MSTEDRDLEYENASRLLDDGRQSLLTENYKEAKQILIQTVDLHKGALKGEYPQLVEAQELLADACFGLGEYQSCFQLYEELLVNQTVIDDSSLKGYVLFKLGKVLEAQNKFDSAIGMYKKGIKHCKEHLPFDDPLTLMQTEALTHVLLNKPANTQTVSEANIEAHSRHLGVGSVNSDENRAVDPNAIDQSAKPKVEGARSLKMQMAKSEPKVFAHWRSLPVNRQLCMIVTTAFLLLFVGLQMFVSLMSDSSVLPPDPRLANRLFILPGSSLSINFVYDHLSLIKNSMGAHGLPCAFWGNRNDITHLLLGSYNREAWLRYDNNHLATEDAAEFTQWNGLDAELLEQMSTIASSIITATPLGTISYKNVFSNEGKVLSTTSTEDAAGTISFDSTSQTIEAYGQDNKPLKMIIKIKGKDYVWAERADKSQPQPSVAPETLSAFNQADALVVTTQPAEKIRDAKQHRPVGRILFWLALASLCTHLFWTVRFDRPFNYFLLLSLLLGIACVYFVAAPA